jgi:hypothetical protein
MGGAGSGRWAWHDKKTTVEECLPLDVTKLVRDGLIDCSPGVGSLVWTSSRTGERTASAGYRRELIGDTVIFRLLYTVTGRGGERHEVDEAVVLQTTSPPIGGVRWWFTCPLLVRGRPCGRRVGKLYLPPGRRYFGCRHCHDLTYESCQESHKYDRLLGAVARDIGCDPSVVKRALSRGG